MRARNPTICLTAAAVALVVPAAAQAPAYEAEPRMAVAGGPPLAFGGPTGRRALDGRWTLRLGGAVRSVRVPFSPNARSLSSMASYRGSIARYRTSFTVAEAGDYAIRFESVNHRAKVWLDGRLVARHTGAYLPFEARRRLTRRAPHARRARGLALALPGADARERVVPGLVQLRRDQP